MVSAQVGSLAKQEKRQAIVKTKKKAIGAAEEVDFGTGLSGARKASVVETSSNPLARARGKGGKK